LEVRFSWHLWETLQTEKRKNVRYFFHIGYKGTDFRGWQQQMLPRHRSIQAVLEAELTKQLKQKITVWGCGRTDAGVHASQYFFHIEVPTLDAAQLRFRLDRSLPRDISIYEIIPMEDPKAHARYNADERSYDYFMHLEPNPFWDSVSTWIQEPLEVAPMKEAVALLPKYEDFVGFCLTPDKHNHTRCTIMKVELLVNERGDRLRFRITANRFLRGMIRILVYNLVEVGAGRMTVADFEQRLKDAQPIHALRLAPPQGLFLTKVVYPFLARTPKPEFDGENWR
jgi:tRNA pseudouridine38-40 synthase